MRGVCSGKKFQPPAMSHAISVMLRCDPGLDPGEPRSTCSVVNSPSRLCYAEHLRVRNYLSPRYTHVPRYGGLVVAPVDDEVMALGLAADGLVDGGVEKVVALRGAKRRRAGRPHPPGPGTCRACRCR